MTQRSLSVVALRLLGVWSFYTAAIGLLYPLSLLLSYKEYPQLATSFVIPLAYAIVGGALILGAQPLSRLLFLEDAALGLDRVSPSELARVGLQCVAAYLLIVEGGSLLSMILEGLRLRMDASVDPTVREVAAQRSVDRFLTFGVRVALAGTLLVKAKRVITWLNLDPAVPGKGAPTGNLRDSEE
jgi:hypothetical protein